jgi:hypothetical protein
MLNLPEMKFGVFVDKTDIWQGLQARPRFQ